jgi:hypothetical protein
VFAPSALLLAVIALGAGSPLGFLLAVPALYLVWVLVVDLSCLLRSGFRASGSYRARPHYWLWVAGGMLPVLSWLAWVSRHLQW